MWPFLKKLGFKGGFADPCIMIRRNKNGLIIVSIYVDDNFCVGHKKALMEFVVELREHGLIIKVAEGLTDYLSYKIVISKDGKRHGLASHTSFKSWKRSFEAWWRICKVTELQEPLETILSESRMNRWLFQLKTKPFITLELECCYFC